MSHTALATFRLWSPLLLAGLLAWVLPATSLAQGADGDEQQDLGEVGAKLSNPLGPILALFTEFDATFFDGNANQGDDEVGSAMIFQPILPLPLHGDDWKILARPTIPIVWSQPRPDGFDKTNRDTGIGDTLLPLLVSPPLGANWIIGAGPTFTLPTSTNDALGRQQWQIGPAGVFGYKTPDYVLGLFPQYFFKVGSRGDKNNEVKDASNMSLLYFGFINLPNAWQVGTNPTITYDHQAESGNRWNVPIGITVAKTTRFGKMPVKFQLGAEYSVVSQDDFGKVAMLKLNIIPVIPSLLKRPILGGS
ncbi:MAG: hypothetical protein JRF61_04470 [Deltaproteobacteria bacterium]|nr:hypothetical protein [Deltaproteobacteria bacterium]